MANKIRGLFVTLSHVVKYATKTGQILAPSDQIEKRMTVCQQCEFLTGSKCLHCGCNMPIKVGLLVANCPLNKWG
jgi:hypothetical protein